MSGPDIFISYSREDRRIARHFAERFAEEGFDVWWDDALHSGETFDEVIENALKAAKAVVVLWSPRSVTSRWVRAEATLADRHHKFAPVIIEPCDRPIIFELSHTTDLSHWTGDTSDAVWRSLVKDLNRFVERGRAKEAGTQTVDAGRGRAPAATRPAPRSAQSRFDEAPSKRLPRTDVDDLMMALSTLQEAIGKAKAADQEEVDDTDSDESERTQFYTGSGAYKLPDEYHCLEINSIEGELEQRFVVSPLGLKIGRSPPADVVLPDARVSRSHCLVELADNALKVTDLKSTNGTFVDGKRIDEPTRLEVGSLLRVGNVVLKHEVRSAADV